MQGEREMGREREGGREELLLPNYSDWAGSALFTNRTRFSNPGSPNLTSKHRGAPDWETGRERDHQKETTTHKKNFVSLFWPVFTLPPLLPPQTPPPLPHRPVASFGLYVVFLGFFPGGETFTGRRRAPPAPLTL